MNPFHSIPFHHHPLTAHAIIASRTRTHARTHPHAYKDGSGSVQQFRLTEIKVERCFDYRPVSGSESGFAPQLKPSILRTSPRPVNRRGFPESRNGAPFTLRPNPCIAMPSGHSSIRAPSPPAHNHRGDTDHFLSPLFPPVPASRFHATTPPRHGWGIHRWSEESDQVIRTREGPGRFTRSATGSRPLPRRIEHLDMRAILKQDVDQARPCRIHFPTPRIVTSDSRTIRPRPKKAAAERSPGTTTSRVWPLRGLIRTIASIAMKWNAEIHANIRSV